MLRNIFFLLIGACGFLLGDVSLPPTPREFARAVRREHPRMFLTPEGIPAFRKRAQTVLRKEFSALCAEVDGFPAKPVLEFDYSVCSVEGKKITFKRMLNDQNACCYAVKSTGGHEALKCAIAWMVTGREDYRQKALAFIRMNVGFADYCHASRILYEWYHFSRLNAIIAYDWLAPTLSTAERKSLMKPMLDHIAFMRHPGFLNNSGGVTCGNYGEGALPYYVGLATLEDGVDDALAEELLLEGYQLFVDMMDYRDFVSGGSGVLTSICSGYSFGAYPTSTFNFLRTLKTAAGIDGTTLWSQMPNYANWFLWATIRGTGNELFEYGFGDSFHRRNEMGTRAMYTHLAQVIDLFGQSHPQAVEKARAAIGILPESSRRLHLWSFPLLPYITLNFDPADHRWPSVDEVLHHQSGIYLRNAGLTIMRSGFTPTDTYAAFKAGARFTLHQHYDENSFIIYRGGFQAVDTGSRGSTPHHKAYYPQTVAHNAMLIRMKDEPLAQYWYPAAAPPIKEKLFSDGGQHVMGRGKNLGFESNDYYVATGGDATACYSAKKCREATRLFVFVKPNLFVVYDRVESQTPEQEKAFLLHFNGKPEKLEEGLYRGTDGEGCLFVRTLLPQEQVTELIGGPGREFWTNGRNYPVELWKSDRGRKNNLGAWRLEIKGRTPAKRQHFLHVLQADAAGTMAPVPVESFQEAGVHGVRLRPAEGKTVELRFRREGVAGGRIRIAEAGQTVLEQELFQPHPAVVEEARHDARVDVVPEHGGRVEFVQRGTARRCETPAWLCCGRGGVALFAGRGQWKAGDVTFRCQGQGRLLLILRGADERDAGGKMLPRWVEFGSVRLNGRDLLKPGQRVQVWHDAPFTLTVPVADQGPQTLSVTYRTLKR